MNIQASTCLILRRTLLATTVVSTLIITACGGKSSNHLFIQTDTDKQQTEINKKLANATTLENYLKRGYIDQYSNYSENSDNDTYSETPTAEADNGLTSSTDDAGGYSTTNIQETGVDEADLIKQNGHYLYAVKQPVPKRFDNSGPSQPSIETWQTSSNPVTSEFRSSVPLTGAYRVDGLYLLESGLAALTHSGIESEKNSNEYWQPEAVDYYSPWHWQSYTTDIRILSTQNADVPQQTSQLSIEGYLISSRVIDNQLYLATKFTPNLSLPGYFDNVSAASWQQRILDMPLTDLLPRVWVNGEQTEHLFKDGECYVPDLAQSGYPSIVALVRVNLNDPTDWEARCNSGRISGVYASADAFVLTGYDNANWDATRLDWYALNSLNLIASGSLPGTLDGAMPSFRLSEQDNNLRILTSSWNWRFWDAIAIDDTASSAEALASASAESASDAASTTVVISDPDWQHRLFVVKPATDGTLDLVSQLPNDTRTTVIGKPGEDVKSVRFFGDRAYVVTFRQTDPLYVINLSDPIDPFIEGELEITGFSSYLHPLSSALLLGIGQAADADGLTQGLKLTLFDTSDAANPTEILSTELGSQGSIADVLHDHHAISFLSTDKGVRMAFTWSHYNDWLWQGDKVYVADIDISNRTLNERLNHAYRAEEKDDESYPYWYNNQYSRVPLQSNGLHLVINGDVTSGGLDSWVEQF